MYPGTAGTQKRTSPRSCSIIIEKLATSRSSGMQRGRRGQPSPNAVSGCKFLNRRIHRSVAPSETCTCHEPPSYSITTHQIGIERVIYVGYSPSQFCRAWLQCRMRGGTPPYDLVLAWATCNTGATWHCSPFHIMHAGRESKHLGRRMLVKDSIFACIKVN